MGTELRCPKGHLWRPDEFDDEVAQLDPAAPVACPYCGALCTMTAEPATRLEPATKPEYAPTGEPHAQPIVPGYEILDILGRGGMGVVYKARQVRTDRVVALKVPGHLDLETRVRFTTEAQAAARISHPHIVQVYEVGEHQGRPFLALEYVDGGTLASMLTGAPLPPRVAATLAETLATAVGAAHAHGVIHRDLKPANILLERPQSSVLSPQSEASRLGTGDGRLGTPKVADFGLARRIDTDTGQTRSGMILGTPDYMAPEQAAGRNKEVGPAADVYALGAILYEMLTGRVPFKGTGMLETLEQVRTLDPVPPRRLQPSVPRDLETICLKCLQKDPARRYAVAGGLADDLRRFLAGEPVQARPISRLERLAKRAKRNPLASGLAVGLSVVMIAAAAYGIVYHLRLQKQRDKARHHLEVAIKSIEELLTTEVSDDTLDMEPRAELKRRQLLEKALAFYDDLLRVEPDDADSAWHAAHGARLMGDIYRLLGRYAEALVAYNLALDRLAPLTARPPPGRDPVREMADCHTFAGEVHRLRGDPAEARAAYQRAMGIQQPLHEANPEHAGYRRDLSRSHYNLGIVARQTGRNDVAIAELTEAARLLDDVPSDDISHRRHRARVYLNLGPAYRAARLFSKAEEACERSIELYDALVAENPHRHDFQLERAVALINQGLVRHSARELAGAKASLTRAADSLAGLILQHPEMPQYKAELARAYNSLAAVAFDAGHPTEGIAMFGKAAEVWAALAAKYDTPEYHGELGISLGNQGRALEKSEPDKARLMLARALIELEIGLKANPKDPTFGDARQRQRLVLAGLLARPAFSQAVGK